MDLTKVDLSKVLPKPGVPFETEDQVHIALLLARLKQIDVEWLSVNTGWTKCDACKDDPKWRPSYYRIAPPPRVVIGPVVSKLVWQEAWQMGSVYESILSHELKKHNGKRFRVEITAKATEILEGEQ